MDGGGDNDESDEESRGSASTMGNSGTVEDSVRQTDAKISAFLLNHSGHLPLSQTQRSFSPLNHVYSHAP